MPVLAVCVVAGVITTGVTVYCCMKRKYLGRYRPLTRAQKSLFKGSDENLNKDTLPLAGAEGGVQDVENVLFEAEKIIKKAKFDHGAKCNVVKRVENFKKEDDAIVLRKDTKQPV